jgi:membrane-bound inhibitor of C-type lysozyme
LKGKFPFKPDKIKIKMKKYILVFAVVIFSISVAFAQNLQIYYNGTLQTNNGSITLNCNANQITVLYLHVKNISLASINVKVRKIENSLLTNSENYFCYAGQCYTPATDTSLNATTIPANTVDTSFSADYNPAHDIGVSRITYVFFNTDNPSDSVSLNVNYSTTVGVNENNKSNAYISEAYPNPASNQVRFSCNLNTKAGQAKISIRNILGASIAELPLSNNDANVIFNTTDLKDGIYFYSLVIDGKILSSKKLIIKH